MPRKPFVKPKKNPFSRPESPFWCPKIPSRFHLPRVLTIIPFLCPTIPFWCPKIPFPYINPYHGCDFLERPIDSFPRALNGHQTVTRLETLRDHQLTAKTCFSCLNVKVLSDFFTITCLGQVEFWISSDLLHVQSGMVPVAYRMHGSFQPAWTASPPRGPDDWLFGVAWVHKCRNVTATYLQCAPVGWSYLLRTAPPWNTQNSPPGLLAFPMTLEEHPMTSDLTSGTG